MSRVLPAPTGSTIHAYGAVFGARFRTLLQYRAAALAGCGTQLFWGGIRMMIFEAFYRSSAAPQPMDLANVITYVWLGQGMLAMLPWNIDPELRTLLRTGNVAYELVRPLDLYANWYARSFAHRLAPLMLRTAPVFSVALLFLGMQTPPSLAAFGAWIAATVGALFLASAIATLIAIAFIRTISGEGIARLVSAIAVPLSGLIIPLPLFPDWAQPILNFLPFRDIMDVPFRLYMGHIPASALPLVLLHQIAWIVALVVFGRWILARETRRIVVQGG